MDGSTTTLLIVDGSPTDREALKAAVGDSVGQIHEAASPEEAWAKAETLDHLHLVVAGIPDENGQSIFEFRDRLRGKFGDLPAAFCSRNDMSAYYSSVSKDEMLFYKPIDQQVMRNWLGEVTGKNAAEAPPVADDTISIPNAPSSETGPQAEAAPEPLPEGSLPVGTVLGDYILKQVIQSDNDFALYEAEQTSIKRDVAIKLLYRKHRKDPVWVGAFVEEARARALINHPSISLVYEAAQEHGVNFYTLELIDAPSLVDLSNRRVMLDDDALWNILESVSSALCYLKANQMRHRLAGSDTIFVVNDDQVRIANPVKSSRAMVTVEEERQQMRLIGEAIRPFLRQGKTDAAIFTIHDRLTQDRIDSIKTSETLKEALHTTEAAPVFTEAEKARINEQNSDKTAVIVGGLVGGLIVIGALVGYFLFGNRPVARDFSISQRVSAGPSIYQDSEKVEVEDFWMSQHEVTIAQYAEFLTDIADNPAKFDEVKHPSQPVDKKSFSPKDWAEIYGKAAKGKKFKSVHIDINCPVLNVEWWDAYAYARWKGGRLPTVQEWEKASRGRTGQAYPWGEEVDLTIFNSGADLEASGEGEEKKNPGEIDGFKYWAPVDAHPQDSSRYDIKNLAGNVTEWTSSWDIHANKPDTKVPLKRGACFKYTEGFELKTRRSTEGPEDTNLWTGFRIVHDADPETGTPSPPPHTEIPSGAAGVAAPAATPAPAADGEEKPAGEPAAADGETMEPKPTGAAADATPAIEGVAVTAEPAAPKPEEKPAPDSQ